MLYIPLQNFVPHLKCVNTLLCEIATKLVVKHILWHKLLISLTQPMMMIHSSGSRRIDHTSSDEGLWQRPRHQR